MLTTFLNRLHMDCPALTTEQLDYFTQGLGIRMLARKQPFLQVGEVPQAVGYVVSGLLKAVYINDQGEQVNVNFFNEGMGVADYQAFRYQVGSRYDFLTIEPTTLIVIPFAHFEQCCTQIPQLERHYRTMLEQALFAYIRRTERFLISTAEERYVDFMHNEPALFRRLSVSDLCSYLGIQRQTLTRIRKQLLAT